jgi:hypothetical protein
VNIEVRDHRKAIIPCSQTVNLHTKKAGQERLNLC